MEEMNNTVIENINEEVVEGVTEQLTFGQTCASYALVGLIGVGAVTTAYLTVKGTKAIINHVKNRKKSTEILEETEPVDIDECDMEDIHNETEE